MKPHRSIFTNRHLSFKYFLDEHGIRRAFVSSPYELLGWYLEDDVQGSLYHCELLFSVIEKVKNGALEEWSGTGNAHTITITPSRVVLENEYLLESEETPRRTCEIPLIEFEKTLKEWFQFIQSDQEVLSELFEVKDNFERAQIRARRLERKLLDAKKRKARKLRPGV